MSGIEITVTGADQLLALSKRLKEAGQTGLRKELNKEIRAAVAPMVTELREAIMSVDSKVDGKSGGASARSLGALHAVAGGHAAISESGKRREAKIRRKIAAGGFGLRATIAAAIQMKIKTSGYTTGVRIRVDGTRLPPDQRSLPRHLDDPAGWRHPVFGHNAWVHQTGRPWFDVVVRRRAPAIRERIIAAMDATAAKIEE